MVASLFMAHGEAFGDEKHTDRVSALTRLNPSDWTKERFRMVLGPPTNETTEGRRVLWEYQVSDARISIQWEKEEALARRVSYESGLSHKERELDYSLPDKLKIGATPITQAIKILGLPDDMALKKATQELHYTYNEKVLRLFFRDGVLVDFTLY